MANVQDFAHQRLSETDMTVEELLALVRQIVNERLSIDEATHNTLSKKKAEEWWQAMVNDLIIPEPGTPSPTEMLREERDQWYKPS